MFCVEFPSLSYAAAYMIMSGSLSGVFPDSS